MPHRFFLIAALSACALSAWRCADPLPLYAVYEPIAPPSARAPAPQVGAIEQGSVRSRGPKLEAGPRPPGEADAGAPDDVGAPRAEQQEEAPRVDLNHASASELEALPGIGPALAARIIARRERRAFRKARDLRRVKGIGPAKWRKLAPLVEAGAR